VVEVRHRHYPHRAIHLRRLAQRQARQLLGAHEARQHRPVLPNHLVGQILDRRDLLGRQRAGREIDRRAGRAQVKRHRLQPQ